jgi:hypothetical protein
VVNKHLLSTSESLTTGLDDQTNNDEFGIRFMSKGELREYQRFLLFGKLSSINHQSFSPIRVSAFHISRTQFLAPCKSKTRFSQQVTSSGSQHSRE